MVIVAEFLNPEPAKKKKRKKVHAKKAFTAYLTVAIVWVAMFIASVTLGLCLPNRPLTSAWALTGVGILNLALVCFVIFAEVAGWSHYAVFWYDRTEELARTVDAARRKKDILCPEGEVSRRDDKAVLLRLDSGHGTVRDDGSFAVPQKVSESVHDRRGLAVGGKHPRVGHSADRHVQRTEERDDLSRRTSAQGGAKKLRCGPPGGSPCGAFDVF
jgi:hypothetical protein